MKKDQDVEPSGHRRFYRPSHQDFIMLNDSKKKI